MSLYDELDFERFRRDLDNVGIVSVVESYNIPLKRRGINHFAICPFHEEKTGSFALSPSKNMYKCFGCQAGGDILSFVMAYEKLDFTDAVRILAQRFGLHEPRTVVGEGKKGRKKKLEEMINFATDWFANNLWKRDDAKFAREYLRNRGFVDGALRVWKIGFAPDSWDDLLRAFQRKGYGSEDLELSGLFAKTETRQDGFYDRFRNRIIFPIKDVLDRCVGFGGRSLEKDNPIKYLNSPQSLLYDKGKILYCLNNARYASINKENTVVIVEGYTDALMAQQYDLRNTVALCGVALTQHHAIALRKLFGNAVVALDPDESGEKAAIKSAMTLMNTGVSVRVLKLPGKDLDEVLLEEGVDNVRQRISSAVPLYEFELEKVLRGRNTEKMFADEKKLVLKELVPFLSYTDGITQCRLYLEETAKRLGVDYRIALAAFSEFKKSRPVVVSPFGSERAEFEALALMLRTGYSDLLRENLSPDNFSDQTRKALFSYLASNGKRLFESSDMLPDSSVFDELFFKPQDVMEYCKKNNVSVREPELYALVSKLQCFSVNELYPEHVLYWLQKAEAEKSLGMLEQSALAAQSRGDTAGVLKAFGDYVEAYKKFSAPFQSPSNKGRQG